jgi:putative transcriptional regulator
MRKSRPVLPLVLFVGFLAATAHGQESQRTFFLVAEPEMRDPNFRETVVLVTETRDAQATGVIINRPTDRSFADLLPGERFKRFTDPIFFGGPVQLSSMFALFMADRTPGSALAMLPGLYLALNPDTVYALVSAPPDRVRFFAGYSGWRPGQLRAELESGAWLTVDADAETVFRKDTSTLWRDMVRRSRAVHAGLGAMR